MHRVRSFGLCRSFADDAIHDFAQGFSSREERFDACVSSGQAGPRCLRTSRDDLAKVGANRDTSYLRVAVPGIIAHTLVAPALARFRQQHPNVRVHLMISEASGERERYDAAIRTIPLDAQVQPHAQRLAVIPEVLCASKAFLAVHGEPINPWDLNGEHCISIFAEGQTPRAWSFRQGETEVKLIPASPLAFSEPRSAVATAVRGGGVILVPALAVEAEIAAGLLTPLLPDWSTPRHAVWIEQHGRRAAGLEAFADFIAGLLPS